MVMNYTERMLSAVEILINQLKSCCNLNCFDECKYDAKSIYHTLRILNADELFDNENYFDNLLMRIYIENYFDLFSEMSFNEFKVFFNE